MPPPMPMPPSSPPPSCIEAKAVMAEAKAVLASPVCEAQMAASSNPTVPLPSTPPPPPPPTDAIVLTLTASGSVSDYSDTSSLQQSVAAAAGVDSKFVKISVAAASVIITATIVVPASSTAAAVQSLLSSTMGTAEAASTALGVTVESTPTVAIASPSPLPPPPSRLPLATTPSPPPLTLGVTAEPTERVHFTLALIGSGLATVALLALLFFANRRSKKASVKAAVGKKSPSLPSVKVGPSIDDQAIQLASAVEAPSDVLAGEGVLLVSTARQRAGLSWFKPTQVKLLTGPHEPAHDGESDAPLWSALVMDNVTVSYDEMAGVRMDVSALEFIVERKSHSAPHAQGGPPPHHRYLHIRMYNRSEFNLWREALSPKITNPTPMACEPKNKSSAVHVAQKWLSSAERAAAS